MVSLALASAGWGFHHLVREQTACIDTAEGQQLRPVRLPSDGGLVAQAFTHPPGGAGQVCTRVRVSTGRNATLVLRLHADDDGRPGSVLRREVVLVDGTTRQACVDATGALPPTAPVLWLALQRTSPIDDNADVYLYATTQHRHRDGQLLVEGREVWGDLTLRVAAPGSTRLALPTAWPGGLPRPAGSLGVLVMVLMAAMVGTALALAVAATMPSARTALIIVTAGALLSLGVRLLSVPPAPLPPPRPSVEGRTLIDELWQADLRTSWPRLAQAFAIEPSHMGGVRARVLLALPESEIRWQIDVNAPVSLDTAVALREEAWQHPGDGAGFTVAVELEGEHDVLWAGHIDPYFDATARRWHDVTVRLDRYVGQSVTLVLRTDAGPQGNAVRDAAIWREPILRPSRPRAGD